MPNGLPPRSSRGDLVRRRIGLQPFPASSFTQWQNVFARATMPGGKLFRMPNAFAPAMLTLKRVAPDDYDVLAAGRLAGFWRLGKVADPQLGLSAAAPLAPPRPIPGRFAVHLAPQPPAMAGDEAGDPFQYPHGAIPPQSSPEARASARAESVSRWACPGLAWRR